MKKNIYLFMIMLLLANVVRAQTNWDFVGPKSTNQAADNKFETGQLSNITIDPYNPLHLFASSWWGGLWESTNRGANWTPIDINTMNANGVSAVTFISSSEVLIGDSYQLSRFGTTNEMVRTYSKAVWKYNFSTGAWTSLGTLTNTSNVPISIRSISIYPGNAATIFVCTSKGVYHSINSGSSWTLLSTANTWVENMLFVPYGSPVNYYCYITGSLGAGVIDGINVTPAGKMMVKQSTNANTASPTFTDLSSNIPISTTYSYSVSKACLAPVDGSGNVQIFLYTKESNDLTYSGGLANIYSFKKNVNTGVLSAYAKISTSGVSNGELVRMAVAYDPRNAGVWYGGIKLSYMKVSTGVVSSSVLADFHTKNGYLHDDMHDISMQNYNDTTWMYVAHDAGIARTIIGTFTNGTPPSSPDGTKLSFNPLNYGIHVSLLRGFSGAEEDPNLYVLGGHDIINTDVYDAATGKNRYTHETWENDGAWIDRFDTNNMFFDANEYGANYYVSSDGGQTKSPSVGCYGCGETFYEPAAGNVFAKGAAAFASQPNGFGISRHFHQDPFRPGRIYKGKIFQGIAQYDPTSKTFVWKIEPWTIQPNLDWTCYSGAWGINSWSLVRGMSFHRDDPNSFYFVVDGNTSTTCPGTPSVIKYIGNNLDDCWKGHNHESYTDGSGTHPQWQNITPNWASLGISSVTDQRSIEFLEIATSPWNKNVVYVMLNVPHNPGIFIIKYDGSTWSNYSQGLPSDEIGTAMVMDNQSFDAIYLSTNKKVYYREMNSGPWSVFKTGLPYVPASQMEINYAENTVRTGLYGRGIWKTDLKCPDIPITFINTNPVPGYIQGTYIIATNSIIQPGKTVFRASNFIELNPKFEADAATGAVFLGYIHGCTNPGNSFARKTNGIFEVMEERTNEEETETNELSVFPNPNTGSFVISIESEEENDVYVYNIMGQQVFEKMRNIDKLLPLDIRTLPKGIYMVKVVIGDKQLVKKVVIE